MRRHKFLIAGLIAALIFAVALRFQGVKQEMHLNIFAIETIRALLTERAEVSQGWFDGLIAEDECLVNWYQGFIGHSLGMDAPDENAWSKALKCKEDTILFLHAILPDEETWADYAVRVQPQDAEAWFWLGDLKPANRIVYYQKGLELNPEDGRRWIELGRMLKDSDPRSAMEAYLQGCYQGDFGYHGCIGAGKMAEELGEIDLAIKYYRHSIFPHALNRAEELEMEFSQ